MNDVKILSAKPVYHANLFDVIEKEIELRNGKKLTHYNVERHPTVSIFPITEKYEIYLIKEYRYLLGKTVLEAPAGFINPQENTLVAAKRELKEETGITAVQWEKLTSIEIASSVIRAQAHLFLAKELEIGKADPEEDEIIEVIKMPLDEAVNKVMTGEISSGSTIAGIMMLDKLKREKKL
ncbi:MAG TPA: NUDIX hydrolase [Candidatus Saccharimonadales bacterium]|nr:NUDIX hydrolase [Candidatus Saccharimonadales bacterium]